MGYIGVYMFPHSVFPVPPHPFGMSPSASKDVYTMLFQPSIHLQAAGPQGEGYLSKPPSISLNH